MAGMAGLMEKIAGVRLGDGGRCMGPTACGLVGHSRDLSVYSE